MGRRKAAPLVDILLWVQADQRPLGRRSLARVGSGGGPSSVAALRAWMREEGPFLANERPWERADIVVCGRPDIPWDPEPDFGRFEAARSGVERRSCSFEAG